MSQEIGFLYDDLFVALASHVPSETWYIKLLAIRNSMYRHWINNAGNHSKLSTSILVILCNAIAILDIRFLSLRDGPGRRSAATLTHALPHEWKELLKRPRRSLHSNFLGHAYELLLLQLEGTIGSIPHDEHLVYLALAGDEPYVGRTANPRVGQNGLHGFSPRWSEHVRDLEKHLTCSDNR